MFTWRNIPFSFSGTLSPRVVPWLLILGLLLLRANRCGQAWLVWLPLLTAALMAIGVGYCPWPEESELREMVAPLVGALGFGWAGTLLVASSAVWPGRLGRFGSLLLGLGIFSLVGLAFGRDWREGSMMEVTEVVCAVLLQFMVFAVAAAVTLAGWSARRGFGLARLVKWFLLWLFLVWIGLTIPWMTLDLFGRREALGPVFTLAGPCFLTSFVASVPFLALARISPLYRQRLEQLLLPRQQGSAPSA